MSLQVDAFEHTETGRRLYIAWVALVAATSGLLFGFDIAVINGALLLLKEHFHLGEVQTEVAASSLLIGCITGAMVGGWLSDRLGRRTVLKLSALLFALSAIGAAIPQDLGQFTAARFAGGVAIGVASLLAPLYIAEVAPARIRGMLVALNQMAIVSGILLAYLVNWGLSFQEGESWRWMFAVAAIPSLFFFVALFFVPESPRWLIEHGLEGEAIRVLNRVNPPDDAEREAAAIQSAVEQESGTLAELFGPGLRLALGLGLGLAVLQQWTGINTIYFYGSVIFKQMVGVQSDSAAIGWNVLLGLVNLLATIVALFVIDRVGRRRLLIGSALGLGVGMLALAVAFRLSPPPPALVLGSMLFCAASFAVGLGPAVWVMLSEIYPNRIRGRAMGLATVALWTACTALTLTFLSLTTRLGASGTFLIYAALNGLMVAIVWHFAPETKGRTLEEIETYWKQRVPTRLR
jgi:SP family arabinose:H+ symporter-like MFS transporter